MTKEPELETKSQGERIDVLLGQMKMLCTQIDQIGLEQQRLLDEDLLEEFVVLLNSRNPKIETLAQTAELVEQLLNGQGVGQVLVQSARGQLDGMAAVVAEILSRDAKQQVIVEKRRDELSKQLSGVGATRNAMRAYSGGDRRPNPTLQDREG
ncbi:MAG: hypothetical protein JKY43_05655 [Phycisphaerales bacterium]|nr:hypothetical protein [Phycisphaerales bacterium]